MECPYRLLNAAKISHAHHAVHPLAVFSIALGLAFATLHPLHTTLDLLLIHHLLLHHHLLVPRVRVRDRDRVRVRARARGRVSIIICWCLWLGLGIGLGVG